MKMHRVRNERAHTAKGLITPLEPGLCHFPAAGLGFVPYWASVSSSSTK